MFKNNFKLGLFAFNASSGSTITTSTKRWNADTDEVINLAKEADKCDNIPNDNFDYKK